MNRLFPLILLICLLAPNLFAQTPVATHGRLRVSGNQIQNSSGQQVQLRGMSFFWSNWFQEGRQLWTRGAVKWLVDDWKIQVIRAPVGVPQDGIVSYRNTSAAARAALDTVIQAAIDYGIYVIVDWHSHNIENEYRDSCRVLMADIARRFGNRPNIIYEIFNEPLNVSWSSIRDYANNIIPAIRQHDANNIIVVGTPNWSQDVDQVGTNRPTGSNIAYALHFYAGTHFQELRNKGNSARSAGNAIFVTEWGTTDASGDGGFNTGSSDEWLSWMDQNRISWVNWSVSYKNETSSIFNFVSPIPLRYIHGGWTSNDLSPSGRYVRGRLRSAAGFNANTFDTPAPPLPSSSSVGSNTNISSSSGPGIVHTVPGTIRADSYVWAWGTRTETNRDDAVGQQLAFIDNGDWVEYLVNNTNVPRAQWSMRFASANTTGGSVRVLVNNQLVATRTISSTGGLIDFTTMVGDSLTLPLGQFVLRLEFATTSSTGLLNLSWLRLSGNQVLVPIMRGGMVTAHQPRARREGNRLLLQLPAGHPWNRALVHNSRGQLVGNMNMESGLIYAPITLDSRAAGTLFLTMEGHGGISSQTIAVSEQVNR